MRRSLVRRYKLFAPRILRIGLLLLVLLLIIDGVAVSHLSQIQAALTLNPSGSFQQGNSAQAAVSLDGPQALLASDTFQRTDQPHWGTSSSGQPWLADAQTDSNFAIIHAIGVINTAPDCAYCEALLGPVTANVEVSFTATLSSYDTSALSAILRWSDTDDLYRMVLDGQTLSVWRIMDGMTTLLQSIAFPAQAGIWYSVRFRAVGPQLLAMVWPMNQSAPAAWQISVVDSVLNTGHAGIGMLVQDNAQAQITAFREVAL